MRIIDPFATQGGQAVNIVDPFESQPPAANGVAGLNIIDPFEQNATQPSPVTAQAEPELAAPVAVQKEPTAPPSIQEAPVVEQAPPAAPAQPATQPVAEQAPTTPQEYPPYEPVQPELTAYTPSFIDRVGRMLGLGPNRDRASVELVARQIAKEQGMSVGEVYKQAGGSRGIFNPEGRATLPAIGEAAVVAGQSAQDIPSAFANTALRAIRGGDISGGEDSFLDYAIKQTTTPDRKVDKNYEDLGGLGKSLGYSFATMGASILAAAGTGLVTANPLVGGAAMMGTSGTVSYRASKDEFLDRVKTQLNDKTKQLYGRELTKDEWQSVRGDFESAAQKYGAWEAIPEAVGNMFMVKAFSAPAKGISKPALNKLVERAASIGVENIGETATGVGQRQAEIEAGLSKEELSVKDAFKQQFLSTMLLGGAMATGAKSKQVATDFYKKYVEPKVNPETALGRAILADLEDAVVSSQAVDAQAVAAMQGAPAPTMEELAGRVKPSEERIEPRLPPTAEPPEEEMITSTAPGISVSYPKERTEPTFIVDPETGEVSPITPIGETTEITQEEAVIEREAQRYAKTYNLPLDLATEVVRGQYTRGELDVESLSGEQPGAETVAGRIEPSVSLPSEGATTTEGVAPLDTDGLAGAVGTAGEPVVGAGTQRTALDVRGIMTANTNEKGEIDGKAVPDAIVAEVDNALKSGTPVTLYADNKPVPIVAINNGMMQDVKGQRWGTIALLTDPDGKLGNKIEFGTAQESQIPTLTERAPTPVQQAEVALQDAEQAVTAAATPVEKKAATVERNKARQALKKVQAAAPAVEAATPAAVEEPVAEVTEPTIPPVETTAKPAVKKWFGNSKAVDSKGEPLVLYRGLVGGEVDPFLGRAGYAIFTSDNPYIASSYSGDPTAEFGNTGGVVYPMYAKVDTVIEFPVDANGVFDKFEFDKRAKNLKPGESLVARNVMDTGPRMSTKMAAGYTKKSGDVWAFANGTKFQSAISPTAPKRGRPAKAPVEGAAPVEPKKRGRPAKAVELTPEERAFKDAERQQNQEDLIKASRGVNKTIKIAESIPQEAKYKTPEEFEMAKVAAASARKTAIYRLHQYATSPAFRSAKASGIKAAQYLASDAVTPKERADLQARLEFEKTRGPKPSAARSKTTEKPVKAFYGFTRASQAIDHIIRNGTPFERALAARLKPLIGDVRLTVADTKENTPDAIQDLLGDAAGVYSSAQFGDKVHRMIVLRGENFDDPALQGVNNIIFLHEALHAATEAKIDQWQELTSLGLPVPPQLQMLVNDLFEVMGTAQVQYEALKASGQPISANLRHKFEKLDITNDPKEFVAYGMTDPDVQKFLLNAPGYTRKDQALGYIKNLFNQFVNSIRRSFNMDAKHQSAMQDLVLVTEGLMQEQEIEPAYSVNTVLDAKVSKSDKALEKVQLSIESNDTPKLLGEAAEVRTFENYQNALQDNWAAMSAGTKTAILIALPTQDIVRWKGKEIPALKDIDLTTQRMAGMRQNLLEAYSKQADVLGKFARKAGKDGMDKMATAMHLARLESVSPSLYADRVDALQRDPKIIQLSAEAANPAVNVNERAAIDRKLNERRTAINNVFNAWEALGGVKDGHKIYKMVRQFYKDSGALTRALLDRHIDSLGLEGEVNDPATPKGRLMLSVRRMYEDGDAKGVVEYFPFMRHGEHVLEVAGPSGREVYFFDTASDRNKFISKRAKQIGADRKDGDVFKAYRYDTKDTRDKFAAESRMLTDMFNAIEDATDTTALDKEMLKDDLYQIYLTTLPEQSFRKRFLHADNVTGFSSDIFRNFKTSATQIATQAAKLRYGPEMHSAMERASDTLQGMPPLMQAELSPFVAEINKRAQDELVQPEDNKIAKGLNQFAFYWLLTGVASAAIQTTALPMYVMPKLNTDYGYGPSAVKFAKWMNVYKSLGVTTEDVDGNVVMTSPTMGESKLVRENPVLQRAFAEAKARNLFGQSFSNVISDRRRTPDNAYDNLPRVMLRNTANVMSGLFTGAERLTREASFMIAFELEYAKSGDFDKAVEKATDVVQEFIGRFDSFSRARIMRNPVGMVVGQFKPYAAIVTSFLVRSAYKALKVTDPKEALKSAHLLGGILLMGSLFHGVTGMPLYSFMVSALYAVLDGLEDEDEKRKRIAKNPLIAENPDFRFRYEFLPKYFGDIKLPAADGRYYPLSSTIEKGPLSVLSDLNIGSRTGLDGIWFKTPKVGKDLQEQTANWLEAFLPAAVSAGKNVVKGIDTINDGKIMQGMSEMLPAFFANPVKTVRIAEEGAKTRKGQQILGKEELSDTNIIAQATGLQSTRVAQLQEQAFKYQSETIRANNERNSLIGKLDDVFLDQKATDKDRQKLMNQIAQHNKRYPMQGIAIDPDTIFRSIDNSIKNRGLTFRGMQIKENLLPYILPIRMQLDRAVSGEK